MHIRSFAAVAAGLSCALVLGACSKPRNATKPGEAKPTTAAKEPKAAAPTAKEVPVPAAIPKAATVVESPDAGSAADTASETFSVAPHIARTPGGAFELPKKGEPAHFRLTPIDGNNNPVRDVEDVLGAKLFALAVRTDTRFAARRVAMAIDARGAAMDFLFPEGGSHVVWLFFKPRGKELQRVPTFFQVEGPMPKPAEDSGTGRVFQAGKLEIALAAPDKVDVCAPLELSTLWTRRSKNLKLTPRVEKGATVDYVAINPGGTKIILATPLPDAKDAIAASPGSRARLVLPEQSRWYVWAFASHGKTESAARFFLDARGKAPPEGCGAP